MSMIMVQNAPQEWIEMFVWFVMFVTGLMVGFTFGWMSKEAQDQKSVNIKPVREHHDDFV